MSNLTIIVAATKSNGIGHRGRLPWRLPKEMNYFARVTSHGVVIMGRNTWDSIPLKFRPLVNRVNVILSRNLQLKTNGGSVYSDLQTALAQLKDSNKTFIIGGASLYAEALQLQELKRILLTRIVDPDFDCDTFMPELGDEWQQSPHQDLSDWVGFPVPEGIQEENGVQYEFQMWVRN